MTSSLLISELYKQVKRVIGKPVSLTDHSGQPYKETHDFPKTKRYHLAELPSRDKSSLELEGEKELRAIPIYLEDKIICLVVTQLSAEDIQMIQIINSLSELLVGQFVENNKPKPDAVDLLLNRLVYRPQTIERDELEQTLSALGYRLDVQRAAVVIELKGFWDNYLHNIGQPHNEKKSLIVAKKNDLEHSLSSFFSRDQDNVIGYIGHDRFLILKDLSGSDYEKFYELFKKNYRQITEALKNVYITDISVGIGSPTDVVGGIISSVDEAVQALEIGGRLQKQNRLYRLDELGVLPLLVSSTIPQKQDFAERLLGEILDDQELLDTLEAFLQEDLNLTQTALKMKVHRNTVIYRLDKITDWVGKDPRRFADAVELYLALTFKRVFPTNS